jgi:hypothetical protein
VIQTRLKSRFSQEIWRNLRADLVNRRMRISPPPFFLTGAVVARKAPREMPHRFAAKSDKALRGFPTVPSYICENLIEIGKCAAFISELHAPR